MSLRLGRLGSILSAMRIAQMILAAVLFAIVMTVAALVLKDVVPPLVQGTISSIGRPATWAIFILVMAVGGVFAYRAEMRARRSDRSFRD